MVAGISKPALNSDPLSGSGSLPDEGIQSQGQQGLSASEDGTAPDSAPAASRVVFKCVGNRRFSRRGKAWADLAQFPHRLDDDPLPGSEEEGEQDEYRSTELDAEVSEHEASSPGGVRRRMRARSSTGEVLCQTKHSLAQDHS